MCHYFRVAKIFLLKRLIPEFSVQFFCLAVSKNQNKIVGESFCVSESLWHRKKVGKKAGAGIAFSVEIVLSSSTETFRRWTLLCFTNFLVWSNFMPTKRISRYPYENLLFYSTEKIRRRSLLCFKNFLVSKIFFCNRGECHDLHSKFVVSQYRKIS